MRQQRQEPMTKSRMTSSWQDDYSNRRLLAMVKIIQRCIIDSSSQMGRVRALFNIMMKQGEGNKCGTRWSSGQRRRYRRSVKGWWPSTATPCASWSQSQLHTTTVTNMAESQNTHSITNRGTLSLS